MVFDFISVFASKAINTINTLINSLLKQLDVKDQQIANLQQALDQQQKLQIATVTENHRLKEHIRKLSGLLEPSSATQQQQSNDKQDQSHIVDEKKKRIHKNKVNKSWWHFW